MIYKKQIYWIMYMFLANRLKSQHVLQTRTQITHVDLWPCGLEGHQQSLPASGLTPEVRRCTTTHIRPSTDPLTLTFIHKSDVLLVCRCESLCWAVDLLRGRTVVAFTIEAIEHDLWGWRAGEVRHNIVSDWGFGTVNISRQHKR